MAPLEESHSTPAESPQPSEITEGTSEGENGRGNEYEDEDVLLNLPPDGSPTSYMQPGDFPVSTPGSTESSEKKNEKQVKRRSSKGK